MISTWIQSRNQTYLHAHLGSQVATIAMFVKEVFGFGFSITVHALINFTMLIANT